MQPANRWKKVGLSLIKEKTNKMILDRITKFESSNKKVDISKKNNSNGSLECQCSFIEPIN